MNHSAPTDFWTIDTIAAELADQPKHADLQGGLRQGSYAVHGKRVMDLALVLLAAPFALVMIGIMAVVVALDGHSPFFSHERIGKDGKSFRCWKIRTMVPDAANRLRAHLDSNPIAREEWRQNFKLAQDPRVTWIGSVLRKTSLDELPQLWNILRGEMSLVGPRPVVEEELPFYGPALPYYTALRPGLTGLWQVSGRNSVDYEHRVLMDVTYGQRLTLWLDLRILLATFWAVIRRTGR